MKRFLIIIVMVLAIVALFLWKHGHNPSANVAMENSKDNLFQRNDVPVSAGKQISKDTKPLPSPSENDPLIKKKAIGSNGISAKQVRGIDFNSFPDSEKQRIAKEYKANFTREFNPLNSAVEIMGTVTLEYRKYEGKFKIRFQKTSKFSDGTRYIPIYMVGVTNPATNMSGMAALEDTSTEGGSIVIHLVGFALMPFFAKDIGANTAGQEKELNEISDIMFMIDPKAKQSSSDVLARFSFDIAESPTIIGRFDYAVKQ